MLSSMLRTRTAWMLVSHTGRGVLRGGSRVAPSVRIASRSCYEGVDPLLMVGADGLPRLQSVFLNLVQPPRISGQKRREPKLLSTAHPHLDFYNSARGEDEPRIALTAHLYYSANSNSQRENFLPMTYSLAMRGFTKLVAMYCDLALKARLIQDGWSDEGVAAELTKRREDFVESCLLPAGRMLEKMHIKGKIDAPCEINDLYFHELQQHPSYEVLYQKYQKAARGRLSRYIRAQIKQYNDFMLDGHGVVINGEKRLPILDSEMSKNLITAKLAVTEMMAIEHVKKEATIHFDADGQEVPPAVLLRVAYLNFQTQPNFIACLLDIMPRDTLRRIGFVGFHDTTLSNEQKLASGGADVEDVEDVEDAEGEEVEEKVSNNSSTVDIVVRSDGGFGHNFSVPSGAFKAFISMIQSPQAFFPGQRSEESNAGVDTLKTDFHN